VQLKQAANYVVPQKPTIKKITYRIVLYTLKLLQSCREKDLRTLEIYFNANFTYFAGSLEHDVKAQM